MSVSIDCDLRFEERPFLFEAGGGIAVLEGERDSSLGELMGTNAPVKNVKRCRGSRWACKADQWAQTCAAFVLSAEDVRAPIAESSQE